MEQAILSGAAVGALYVLMTVGFSLNLGIADIVNLAHGTFVVAGMYITLELSRQGIDAYVATLIAAAVVGLLSYPIYLLFMKPARAEGGHRTQLVFSLLIFSALIAAYQLMFSLDVQSIDQRFPTVELLGGYLTVAQIVAIVLAIVVSLALFLAARHTMLGKTAYVASLYPVGAKSIGVPVQRIYSSVFVLSGVLAGLAGGILMTFQPVEPTLGLQLNTVVFLVALVSRTHLLWGLALGFAYGIVQSVLSYTVDAAFAATATLLVFLIALVAEHFVTRSADIYRRVFSRPLLSAGVSK